jgi:hypothetical protein
MEVLGAIRHGLSNTTMQFKTYGDQASGGVEKARNGAA